MKTQAGLTLNPRTGLEKIAAGFGLLEGPLWDPGRGLLVADSELGGVYRVDDHGSHVVIPHRRGIGGLARHVDGGLIVSGRNLAYKGASGAQTRVLIENDAAVTGLAGFSDLTSAPDGSVYAGLLGSRPDASGRVARAGGLYRVRLDGTAECIISPPGVLHTNGLAFSPEGRHLYYADSGHRTVFRYDVLGEGKLAMPIPFATLDEGVPDGLAVAADGSVWVAAAFAGEVRAYAADGRLVDRIAVPESLVTNVCFGEPGLSTLFITTGSLDPTSRIGAVYRIKVPVPGAPVLPASFRHFDTPSRLLFPAESTTSTAVSDTPSDIDSLS